MKRRRSRVSRRLWEARAYPAEAMCFTDGVVHFVETRGWLWRFDFFYYCGRQTYYDLDDSRVPWVYRQRGPGTRHFRG